jgi:methylenetetrahydrofolate reductase (NADPH)
MTEAAVLSPSRTASGAIADCIAELVSGGSVEMSAHNWADAAALGDLLPAGTKVYVNHLPRHTLRETLSALEAVHRAGLEPVPHVAARRIGSRAEFEGFARRAVGEAGVRKVLLIGGDDPKPVGPFDDSVALLASGVLAECGVREIGIAGYPEGHARIPQAALERAMLEKLSLAAAQGLGAYVVTQFSFAPARVIEYCSELARLAPAVPVYVGMAGPADAATLLRYAQRCGVSASLRALRAQGMGLVRLVTHTDPNEQLVALARHCLARRSCNVVGAHFFSFGGAARTAQWMNRAIVGGVS